MATRIFISLIAGCLLIVSLSPLEASITSDSKQNQASTWNISATASAISDWAAGLLLAERLNISTRVLSVRDDGIFIDVGQSAGASVGQIYEIYRTPHSGAAEEVAGVVQVAWTRADYSFAEPYGEIDLNQVSTLFFARLVNVPPIVALTTDTSEGGGGGTDLNRLVQAIYGLLSLRSGLRAVLSGSREPAWTLTLTPDFEGATIRVVLTEPGGEIGGNILLDPYTGERLAARTVLDEAYFTGKASPFDRNMAPRGRRMVRIVSGNIVPGSADELAVLDNSDLWIYDLTSGSPRLLSTMTVSIPPGRVRHRTDAGSLELVDLNENGLNEICISPPGADRGEIWRLDSDTWVLLGYLSYPARCAESRIGGVVVGPYQTGHAAIDPSLLEWCYPLTETEPTKINPGFAAIDIEVYPDSSSAIPSLAGVDESGVIHIVSSLSHRTIGGNYGNCIAVGMYRNSPVILATSSSITTDNLIIINPNSGEILAQFASESGPIIGIALGDIDHDSKSEIILAVLEPDGVKIYY